MAPVRADMVCRFLPLSQPGNRTTAYHTPHRFTEMDGRNRVRDRPSDGAHDARLGGSHDEEELRGVARQVPDAILG